MFESVCIAEARTFTFKEKSKVKVNIITIETEEGDTLDLTKHLLDKLNDKDQ